MKVFNILTGIAFICLLIFASGLDHATLWNWVGTIVCALWLAVDGVRRLKAWTK